MHLHLNTHFVEPVLGYMRTLRFTGPEQVKRYFRLFGDLEYDLLSLRAESAVMELRLREVRRRAVASPTLTDEEERRICSDSQGLVEHLFERVDRLQRSIAASRSFRFDPAREQQCYCLLADIAYAILGIEESAVRARERETLTVACDAYGRLDLSALIDLHDSVQPFLALQRRERLDEFEETEWRQKNEELQRTHPLCCVRWLDEPRRISERMAILKKKIERQQQKLERIDMLYTSIVSAIRHRN